MQYAFAGPESSHDTLFWQTNSIRADGLPVVYKSIPKCTQKYTPCSPHRKTASCHTAGSILTAQLDALESILCSTTLTQALGAAPLLSATELGLLLERYRTNVLEPIELPAYCTATAKRPRPGAGTH